MGPLFCSQGRYFEFFYIIGICFFIWPITLGTGTFILFSRSIFWLIFGIFLYYRYLFFYLADNFRNWDFYFVLKVDILADIWHFLYYRYLFFYLADNFRKWDLYFDCTKSCQNYIIFII